jgi:hypothetical protein
MLVARYCLVQMDPMAATSQVAVQVAQAAQAVQQQAQSLQHAAEVHAQKAHAATSQVQSLQATAQVRGAGCGEGGRPLTSSPTP